MQGQIQATLKRLIAMMTMKDKFKVAHMKAASVYAELSYANRRKVGCVVVKNNTIIGIGYNGTPAGWDNACEVDGKTKPEVMHAEQNALDKVAMSTMSSLGASVFVTTAPCIECAKRIFGSGIARVYYRDVYRSTDGIEFLDKAGIPCEQINAFTDIGS